MREDKKDPVRLDHILDSIDKLINADQEKGLENIPENSLEYFGIVKLLEIIGEAAYMLTKDFTSHHPQTPWKQIIGMRHVLVHGYYQVNQEDVIMTIKENLIPLRHQIVAYLSEF